MSRQSSRVTEMSRPLSSYQFGSVKFRRHDQIDFTIQAESLNSAIEDVFQEHVKPKPASSGKLGSLRSSGDSKEHEKVSATDSSSVAAQVSEELKRIHLAPIQVPQETFQIHTSPDINSYYDLVDSLNILLRLINEDNVVKRTLQVRLDKATELLKTFSDSDKAKKTKSESHEDGVIVKEFKRLSLQTANSSNYYDSKSEYSEFSDCTF